VALVRADISEELSASIIRVTIGELGTMEALSSSETLVLTRATPRNIPEDSSLHSHRRKSLKSYIDGSASLQQHSEISRTLTYTSHVGGMEETANSKLMFAYRVRNNLYVGLSWRDIFK
jgi:hypothetical protein